MTSLALSNLIILTLIIIVGLQTIMIKRNRSLLLLMFRLIVDTMKEKQGTQNEVYKKLLAFVQKEENI